MVIDFSKTFEHENVPTLMHNLRAKGVGGRVLDLFRSMYCGTTSRVEVNGILTKRKVGINSGIAQADVISPLF